MPLNVNLTTAANFTGEFNLTSVVIPGSPVVSGTFSVALNATATSSPIPSDASSSVLERELELLSGIDVIVSRSGDVRAPGVRARCLCPQC
jgi:hypothetical protein